MPRLLQLRREGELLRLAKLDAWFHGDIRGQSRASYNTARSMGSATARFLLYGMSRMPKNRGVGGGPWGSCVQTAGRRGFFGARRYILNSCPR